MVRASGRSRSVPTSVSPGPTSAARDMLTLETLRSPGSHGTTCSQFSSYSFLGYLSSISDAGSCPSSWPPDAGRLQGFDEAPLLFSLSMWGSPSSFNYRTEAAASRQPLQLRLLPWAPDHLTGTAGCPLDLTSEVDPNASLILCSRHTQARAHTRTSTSSFGFPLSPKALLSTSLLMPMCRSHRCVLPHLTH